MVTKLIKLELADNDDPISESGKQTLNEDKKLSLRLTEVSMKDMPMKVMKFVWNPT